MKIKTQIAIDYHVNAKVKVHLGEKRKKGETTLTKEQYLGKIIEEYFENLKLK